MKAKEGLLFIMACGILFLGSCRAGKENASQSAQEIPVMPTKPMMKGGFDSEAVPNATVFRMNGDYSNNVAITLNVDGSLAYYPDPSDITSGSAPYPLADGWYLNRQGIGPDSKFTAFSFEEYRNLNKAPSHKELIDAVIPGASVTEFVELPVSASEALANPQICLQYLP